MQRSNYLYLGFAFGCLILAAIQWRSPELLSITLYYTIASISLSVSILEFIKTAFYYLQKNTASIKSLYLDMFEKNKKRIEILSRFDVLEDEKKHFIGLQSSILEKKKSININAKRERILKKLVDAATVFQIIATCVFITLRLTDTIPANFANNKIVSILSLLSFAFLMFTYFFREKMDSVLRITEEHLNLDTEDYYLSLLEKVAPVKTDDNNR